MPESADRTGEKKDLLGADLSLSQEERAQKARILGQKPEGKVPTLRDGDTVIYDSTIINEDLEERYPEVSLTYAGPHRRAKVR